MIKVLFVCHGNICRSPMAEFIMKDLVKKAGREKEFYIESAATSSEEIWNGIGNPVYPPAKEMLRRHQISCDGKRARQMTKKDYEQFDYLICMDDMNMRNMLRICGSDPDKKMAKLLTFAGLSRGVSDPWYTGDFQTTWDDIYLGCSSLLEQL